MIKNFAIILILSLLTGCGALMGYETTTFYVKNDSEKPINFQASVIKRGSMGPFEVNNVFTVLPKDSVLARQVGYKKDTENPQKWFNRFRIFPVDGIEMNDPYKPENWIEGTDQEGKRIFTFTIAE